MGFEAAEPSMENFAEQNFSADWSPDGTG